jgi:hypothetical protein
MHPTPLRPVRSSNSRAPFTINPAHQRQSLNLSDRRNLVNHSPVSDDGATTNVSPHERATPLTRLPADTAPSEHRALRWIRYALGFACVVAVFAGLYGLSLGPVMYYYKTHPISFKLGVVMYTFKGTPGRGAEDFKRSVICPIWVRHFYSPAFRLRKVGEGESGLGGIYGRYLFWCVDRRAKCLSNLRRLDEAKRKWASDTQKMDGDTPFAAHIVDYLPKRSMPKCPTGGEYQFKPVGAKPACSDHGDNF